MARNIKYLVLMLLAGFCLQSRAYHMTGGYMYYTHQGGTQYKITAVFWRDCRGIAFNNPYFGVYAGTNGGSGCGSYTLSGFTRTSIRDVTYICSAGAKPCNPTNTGGTGEGIEEHVYEKTVDFSTTPLSNFTGKSSCAEVTFYAGITTNCTLPWPQSPCCGDYVLTTTIQIINIQKTVNKKGINNSTRLTIRPQIFPCCNAAYFYDPGILDTLDRDSLSFRQSCQLCYLNSGCRSYLSPFSYKVPITPYCVGGGTVTCTPNPNTNPPRGFFFDTVNGSTIYTPTNCSEVGYIAFESLEYRKDSSGKWLNVGRTYYSFMNIISSSCGYNKAPVISGPYENKVCAGDKICFSINAKDETFTPNQTIPDTVKLTWNGLIPGATFKIKDSTAREKTAEFCWQTSEKDISDVAYTFSAIATDQHCSKPIQSSRAFRIKVYKKAKGKFSAKYLKCGGYGLYAAPDSGMNGSIKYKWEIKNTAGKTIGTSNKKSDTLFCNQSGKIYIFCEIAYPYGCPAILKDSLAIPALLDVKLPAKDTFACYKTAHKYTTSVFNSAGNVKYKWSYPKTESVADTFDKINITIDRDTVVVVKVTDTLGCTDRDTLRVSMKPLPYLSVGKDQRICTYQQATFTATVKDTTAGIKWNTGDTTRQITKHIAGDYIAVLTEKKFQCRKSDTVHLFVNDTVKSMAGADATACAGDTLHLTANYSPKSSSALLVWYDVKTGAFLNTGTRLDVINPFKGTDGAPDETYAYQFYTRIIESGVTCISRDTVKTTWHSRPKLIWYTKPLNTFCPVPTAQLNVKNEINSGNLPGCVFWSGKLFQPDGIVDNGILHYSKISAIQRMFPELTENIYVRYTDSNGCTNRDSNTLKIKNIPIVRFSEKTMCQDVGKIPMKNLIDTLYESQKVWYEWSVISAPAGIPKDSIIRVDSSAGKKTYYFYFGQSNENHYDGEYQFRFCSEYKGNGCMQCDTVKSSIIGESVVKANDAEKLCRGLGWISLNPFVQLDGQPIADNEGKFKILSYAGNRSHPFLKDTLLLKGHTFNTAQKTGAWQLRYEIVNKGCPARDSLYVYVDSGPVARFTAVPDSIVYPFNPKVQFYNQSSYPTAPLLRYHWDFGTGNPADTSNDKDPEFTYSEMNRFCNIRLKTYSSNGCEDSFAKRLQLGNPWLNNTKSISGEPLILTRQLAILNSGIQQLSGFLYDPAGRLVLSWEGKQGPGQNAIDRLPAGIYLYNIKATAKPGVQNWYSGRIELP
ncbi:MAG: hypothetical protein JNL57_05375 [Bacteroidetes bacterium]|nr:hypothetical protein [Bacteroidota bacterium]